MIFWQTYESLIDIYCIYQRQMIIDGEVLILIRLIMNAAYIYKYLHYIFHYLALCASSFCGRVFFLSWISIYYVIFSSLLNYCNYQVNSLKKYIKYVHLVESFKKKILKYLYINNKKRFFIFYYFMWRISYYKHYHHYSMTSTIQPPPPLY